MEDFRKEILKVKRPRIHKIKYSLGVYDAYRWIRTNNWLNIGKSIPTKDFYKIIRKVNTYIALELITKGYTKLPLQMGELVILKLKPTIKFKDGKVISSLPVDWDTTLKLWEEDAEAKKNKTLVKKENSVTYKIAYKKAKAKYPNKIFYSFHINRKVKINLKELINQGCIDAFIYER